MEEVERRNEGAHACGEGGQRSQHDKWSLPTPSVSGGCNGEDEEGRPEADGHCRHSLGELDMERLSNLRCDAVSGSKSETMEDSQYPQENQAGCRALGWNGGWSHQFAIS